jgi:tripartite-type tricarboxylate transporter receptor subunit TctC
MKKVMNKLSLLGSVALLAAAAWSGSAAAQYPTKPINVIIAYGPGGGTDLIARLIAPFIEKHLGNNARLVITNRPGAGGGIGFAEIARATPDGYTIGFVNTPNMLSIPIERPSTFGWQSYDLIGNLIDDPGAFTVNTSTPITNLKELAAYAKANPGKVTVGTTGVGSDDHLAMLLFERSAGVKMTHVPYKGSGETRAAVVGGQIMLGAINVGEALSYIKGGSPIRMIGQMSAKRTVLAPNVPTFAEQGYNIESASLRGMAAPKGLPPEIREKLVTAVAKAAADPEYIRKAGELFAPIRYLAPKEYAVELENTDKQLRQLWKQAPWKE